MGSSLDTEKVRTWVRSHPRLHLFVHRTWCRVAKRIGAFQLGSPGQGLAPGGGTPPPVAAKSYRSPTLVATDTNFAQLTKNYPNLRILNTGDTFQGLILYGAYTQGPDQAFDYGMWTWLTQYNPGCLPHLDSNGNYHPC